MDSTSPRWLNEAAVAAALLAAGALAIGLAGPVPQTIYPSDTANYLDACHSLAAGLVLDRDFSAPIGPAAFWPTAIFARMGGASAAALALGECLTWIAYGVLGWLATRRRMPGWLAAGFALFVAATAAAPYTLDFGNWRSLSYGMMYNRLAWAALALVAVPSFLPRRDGGPPWAAAAGHGACAVWLWAIKPNYLLIQFPLSCWSLLGSDLRGRQYGKALLWFAAGAGGMLAVVAAGVPFDPLAYLRHDLSMAQAAPGGLLHDCLVRTARANLPVVGLLLAGWAAAWGLDRRRATGARLGLFAVVAAATVVANMTNCQFGEIPVFGAAGWILAAWAVPIRRPAARGLVAAAAVVGLAYTWQPCLSLPYALWRKVHPSSAGPDSALVASPAWSRMPMRFFPSESAPRRPDPNGSAGDYALWLDDGLALWHRAGAPPGPVLCLDWNDPFSLALAQSPLRGDDIAWHVGRYLDAGHHPDARALIAQAAAVMEPRDSVQPASLAFKRELFTPWLRAEFRIAAESADWRLWVRRSPPPP
ncbi:MAG TPA: hypothetical protein VHC86_00800 [Opitutaceae bacterium]|nr:hypothetical protein [Opitutaceae bacterium]